MRILLVRHGESKGNVDPTHQPYIDEGDQNLGLTDNGWRQALAAGNFLRSLYKDKWPLIYLSSYTRTKETLAGLSHSLKDKFTEVPKIYEDPRLIEKHFGATNLLNNPQGIITDEFAEQFNALSNHIYQNDPFTTRNPLGESNKDNLLAVKSFIDGTFARDMQAGHDEFLFITHGATILNFLVSWAHLPMIRRDDLTRLNNCDIISIEGASKSWSIRKIYDGAAKQETDIDILDGIKPYGFEDLPAVPKRILKP